MREENWFPIKEYEGLYEINVRGEIRSLHKRNKDKVISKRIDRAGYYTVRLSKKAKTSTFYIHRLLGFAFISNPDNKPFINHKDCNKLNNNLWNLEWVTHSENIQHAYRVGVLKKNKGKDHHEAVMLKCAETEEIFYTIRAAAEKSGINYNTFRNSLNTNAHTGFIKLVC